MTITAYPLQWPTGWPRSVPAQMKRGKFGVRSYRSGSSYKSLNDITVSEATRRILSELGSMGVDSQDIVISTNIKLRLDGLPRSGEKEPDDSGAAVYWVTASGDHRVMAIDRYYTVADNLAAIAATLDAMRAIERHGGAQILDRAFTGFTALPAPGASKSWRDILDVPEYGDRESQLARARLHYRAQASANHPDRGGSADRMAEINRAWAEAQEYLS
jgi:hypothetical protein